MSQLKSFMIAARAQGQFLRSFYTSEETQHSFLKKCMQRALEGQRAERTDIARL